ncbi:hypothetical protein ACFY0P_15440 [Streptomyces sp. NPDC001714]|uniref:hypothetical protein n=1 Tax=Streptomyces sp. NPDC001714 TaxID=3364603 RepID=UPI0036C3E3B7
MDGWYRLSAGGLGGRRGDAYGGLPARQAVLAGTRANLRRAAVGAWAGRFLVLPGTGSVEGDLRQVLRRPLSASRGLTLLRIAVLPHDPERSEARRVYWGERLARVES